MNSLLWIKIWFITLLLLPLVGLFNYVIDPLCVNGNHLFELKNVVQTTRDSKVIDFKNTGKIDNIILGSSRTMKVNPDDVSNYLGGNSFNFSVNKALPEDHYGILLYLERIKKIPKNIVIGFDFYILNDLLPTDKRFLANRELNFLDNYDDSKGSFLSDYLNIDVLKYSINSIYYSYFDKKNKKNISKFDKKNGFLYQDKNDVLIKSGNYNYTEKIKTDSDNYFNGQYNSGKYIKLSKKRIEYLIKIKEFTKKYNINLYTYLTPVHCYHLNKIKQNKALNETMKKFKKFMLNEFNSVDLMVKNKENCIDENFYDAVHPSYEMNKKIIDTLFSYKL